MECLKLLYSNPEKVMKFMKIPKEKQLDHLKTLKTNYETEKDKLVLIAP